MASFQGIRNVNGVSVFVILMAFLIYLAGGSVLDLQKFARVKNATVSDGQNSVHSSVRSIIDCASKCMTCQMVSYDVTTKVCKTYPELNTTLTISSTSVETVWLRQRHGASKLLFIVLTTKSPWHHNGEDTEQMYFKHLSV